MLLNKLMKSYIKGINKSDHIQQVAPTWCSFTLWEDCVLLENSLKNVTLPESFSAMRYDDRTSIEADFNHLHMNTLFTQEVTPVSLLQSALSLLNEWERKLKAEYPERSFHLILSYDGDDVVVRFYGLRESELPWIDIDNLENYKLEGVLVKII
ncbi:hypothetical protein [Paenibacillus typhae]|uniref:Uncharacterized protein n=1 Tax=Paenibacillus typhae TaxID=1174501 RepID=A0A1G9DZE9_9BACL|nr:hypothetical protein [Paenibacillus typhae]SDK69188.1 hypothetical protein SAMN05216192_15038 [Paenibacillus typhae]